MWNTYHRNGTFKVAPHFDTRLNKHLITVTDCNQYDVNLEVEDVKKLVRDLGDALKDIKEDAA